MVSAHEVKTSSLLVGALIAIVCLLGFTFAEQASAGTRACGKVKAATGGKARVAAVKTNCKKARRVAVGYYKRQDRNPWNWDGKNQSGLIFYRVRGYRCFTGLGGSQAFCSAGNRRVLASTRKGDRPARW